MAFFAKGRIKGDFLLTMAYDSAREKKDARDRLKGTIEPDRYYLLYGDGTEQRFEAASQGKLYLKIERRQFVALFGDFDTGFTVTELTQYNRSLSGLRSDFGGERVQVSGFAARTDTGLVQDELQGDGTSGLYRLSRSPIVIGSDKLRIEVRDRFEITRVVETRELSRFIDYDLDYERGTMFFKEPVPSRDQNLNPVFIVVDYEVRTGGEDETAAGLRVATKFARRQARSSAPARCSKAPRRATRRSSAATSPGASSPETRVRAEVGAVAVGRSAAAGFLDRLAGRRQTRLRARSRRAPGRARSTTASASASSSPPTPARARAGVDARYKFNEQFDGRAAKCSTRTVLASDAKRLLVSADLRMQRDGYSVGRGLRHVADEDASGDERVSDQAFVTGSVDVWDGR